MREKVLAELPPTIPDFSLTIAQLTVDAEKIDLSIHC